MQHILQHASLCRAYGCDAPVGLVYGINPFMIIFMVPFVGALTTNFAHFDMIHYGSYISALSPFWIVAFPTHGKFFCSIVYRQLVISLQTERTRHLSRHSTPQAE